LGKTAPAVTVVPSMIQITGKPLSCCQRISDLPSPLKSAVAATCQVGPTSGRAAQVSYLFDFSPPHAIAGFGGLILAVEIIRAYWSKTRGA
jgi:hypothetical protein